MNQRRDSKGNQEGFSSSKDWGGPRGHLGIRDFGPGGI